MKLKAVSKTSRFFSLGSLDFPLLGVEALKLHNFKALVHR